MEVEERHDIYCCRVRIATVFHTGYADTHGQKQALGLALFTNPSLIQTARFL